MMFHFVLFSVLLPLTQSQTLPETLEIKIPTGRVGGHLVSFRSVTVYQFLGIPFAEPPLNELRFKKPEPVKPWEGIVSSTRWPPQCLQGIVPGINSGYQVSEDCLTLNVFTPSVAVNGNGRLRPVMVWIHGGGFSYGSAHWDRYNGTVLAALEDVVLVSINYRLGPLGFLHLPEHGINGNLGLWDQRLALQWVQENIKYFGGDPNEVTAFGVSAGAMSLSALIVSPHARGLFRNAVLQSGSIYDMHLWSDPNANEIFLSTANCKSADDVASCLRATNSSVFTSLQGMLFWPVYGDEFLPNDPTELIKSIDPNVNVLLGVVGNEGASLLATLDPVNFNALNPVNLTLDQARKIVGRLYGHSLIDYIDERFFNGVDPNDPNELRLAIGHTLGDIGLSCPTFMFGHDALRYSGSKVFGYYLTQKPSKLLFMPHAKTSWIPATHGDDIALVFGNPLNYSDHTIEDVIISMIMVNAWGHFARTGETPRLGSQEWLEWKLNGSGVIKMFVMELNSQKLGQVNNELAERCYKNWPFPIKRMNLLFGYQKDDTEHEEL